MKTKLATAISPFCTPVEDEVAHGVRASVRPTGRQRPFFVRTITVSSHVRLT